VGGPFGWGVEGFGVWGGASCGDRNCCHASACMHARVVVTHWESMQAALEQRHADRHNSSQVSGLEQKLHRIAQPWVKTMKRTPGPSTVLKDSVEWMWPNTSLTESLGSRAARLPGRTTRRTGGLELVSSGSAGWGAGIT